MSGSSTTANTLATPLINDTSGNATSLAKIGTGTWVLTKANTYSGTTAISGGGTLTIDATSAGSLPATSSIEVDPAASANSTFRLVSSAAAGSTVNLINDNATLAVTTSSSEKGIIDLAFANSSSGNPVVEKVNLFLINGVAQPAGLYSSFTMPTGAESDAESFFADSGELQVVSAPEPASIALLAMIGLPVLMRRRRNGDTE